MANEVKALFRLPIDRGGNPMQITPRSTALARIVDTSISSSTEITLNASTTFLRIYAKTQDVYLKWGTDDVTTSNFDEVIPAGQVVDLGVALQSDGTPYTAINLIEATASASVIVIEK